LWIINWKDRQARTGKEEYRDLGGAIDPENAKLMPRTRAIYAREQGKQDHGI
jgi:hypothetical protein